MEGGGWEEKVDLEKQESGENSGFKKITFSGSIQIKSFTKVTSPSLFQIQLVKWSDQGEQPPPKQAREGNPLE